VTLIRATASGVCLLCALTCTGMAYSADTAHADEVTSAPVQSLSVRLIGSATSEQHFNLEVFAEASTPLPTGEAVSASWVDPATGEDEGTTAFVEADNIARFQIKSWRSTEVTLAYGSATAQLEVAVAPARSPVRAPAKAPLQRSSYRVNPDPAAIGDGANAIAMPINAKRRASMMGLSWHRGCVPMASLREIQVNYWGADGYRHRGVLIANASVAARVRSAFTALYKVGYRIRSMHPVDAYGKNPKGVGANDYASMAAGNTSMFNCRYQVGKEHRRVWSPHASGRALDLNTWENPYLAPGGIYPNVWWFKNRASSPMVIRGNSAVTKILRDHGWVWGARYKDYQHFDYHG